MNGENDFYLIFCDVLNFGQSPSHDETKNYFFGVTKIC